MQANTTALSSSRRSTSSVIKAAALKRARSVSMYSQGPREELSLEEFEEYAVDRLVVLRLIENLRLKGFKSRELEQQLSPLISKHIGTSPRKDEISHFILRLAYSKNEELRRWFLAQETALFRLRLETLGALELDLFLTEHDIKFEEADGDHYKIPFERALDLVARREAVLSGGMVLVPRDKVHSILVALFRTQLSKSLTKASQFFGAVSEDPRLAPLLKNVQRHDSNVSTNEDSGEDLTADMLDSLAEKSMPLCMRTTHQALRREHKLKHWGRVQYGLFLKAAGLPMDEQVAFFQQEFTKVMSHDQFQKEYAYGIRHRYGQEGKRTDYTPYGCFKIIMDFAPGPGEYHGCPYRHFSKDRLSAAVSKLNLGPSATGDILDLAKSHNYQLACQRHFELTHPQTAAGDAEVSFAGVGNHPNAFFKASRAYHKHTNTK